MPNWAYPHTFHDGTGETASGAQVSEDFTKAKEEIERAEGLITALEAFLAPLGLTNKIKIGTAAISAFAGWSSPQIVFPVAYPTACTWAMVCPVGAAGASLNSWGIERVERDKITVALNVTGNEGFNFYYIAIGN